MKKILYETLKLECEKIINRHYDYLNSLSDDIRRKNKRYNNLHKKIIKYPPYWNIDKGFSPFKCRAKKSLKTYSHTIATKIKEETYSPQPAIIHKIDKADGTKRELNIFQLPDAALSRLVYKSLLHKNLHRLNSYAFAYREDINGHDAINYIYHEWKNIDRVYIAEFDFSKYFDNISHKYIWECFSRLDILCTPEEKFVVESFLNSESCEKKKYKKSDLKQRKKGIPQGTSISLFLANLVCTELDRSLERLGVGFVRYADDTIVWSDSYQKVVEAYETIRNFGIRMGVPLNMDKSEGISLLSRDGKGELSSKPSVDYLGYTIGHDYISISDKKIIGIKKKISYIIYQNLVQPLKKGVYTKSRLSTIDWDYLVAVSQVRRYLYGGLTNSILKAYLYGKSPRVNFKGLMSYYPLINNTGQLANIDGWMIYTFSQALKLREKMWLKKHKIKLPCPVPNWIKEIDKLGKVRVGNDLYDLSIPSFSLINKAMKASINRRGLSSVVNPRSIYYQS